MGYFLFCERRVLLMRFLKGSSHIFVKEDVLNNEVP